jgi:hypothetical protein
MNKMPTADELQAIAERPTTSHPAPFDWRATVETAEKLQTREFPPVAYVVPGLVPEGLTLLAGKPKIGKSWMALDLCAAVSAGRICLGDRRPVTGDVLYAALEDNPRRLQRRLDKVLGASFTDTWPARLSLTTSWRRLDKGGVDDLGAWADSVAEPRLIVLDTLAGVRPINTQQGYTEDYSALAAVHRMANDRGLAVLVLHHTRKMEADDPVDTISGTLGLSGVADTLLVLGRTSKGSTLYVRGRDVEEAEHAVEFHKESCRWTILGVAADVQRSDERSRIIAALQASSEPMGPSEIADASGMKPTNVRFLLHKMMEAGEVRQEARGRYVAA